MVTAFSPHFPSILRVPFSVPIQWCCLFVCFKKVYNGDSRQGGESVKYHSNDMAIQRSLLQEVKKKVCVWGGYAITTHYLWRPHHHCCCRAGMQKREDEGKQSDVQHLPPMGTLLPTQRMWGNMPKWKSPFWVICEILLFIVMCNVNSCFLHSARRGQWRRQNYINISM